MNKDYDKDQAAQTQAIYLYNDVKVPKATDGPIRIDLEQKIDGVIAPTGAQSIYLTVQGPYDRLQPSDVVGCYPADQSDTSPEEFVPHIALGRRSLPWERSGVTDENGAVTPWMALLLLTESQLELIPGFSSKIATMSLSQLAAIDKGAHDKLHLAYPEETSLDILRVEKGTLAKVLPRRSEVSLLCHMQQLVGPPADASADQGDASDPMWLLDPDNQVAVVVGNRLPSVGDGTSDPEKHYACLVTIEQRDDLPWPGANRTAVAPPVVQPLPPLQQVQLQQPLQQVPPMQQVVGGPVRMGGAAVDHALGNVLGNVVDAHLGNGPIRLLPVYVHLAVLRYWTFKPSTGGDFEQVMKLIRYVPHGGVLRFGMGPDTIESAALSTITPDGKLDVAVKQGGTASYHGPLVPSTPPPRSPLIALRAQAGANAPAPGVEADDSLAAAFELGRMLTVADSGLLSDLQGVRQQITIPRISRVYEVPDPPAALKLRNWSPDPPDWGSLAGLPDGAADPSGVQSIAGQIGQIAGGLQPGGGVQVPGGGLIDIGNVVSSELDAQFAQVVAAQKI